MPNSNKNTNIPTIGIQSFRQEQLAGRNEILLIELEGEKYIEHSHKHDFLIITLFDQSCGTHSIEGVDYTVGNKEIHILFPDQVHKWHLKENTKGYQLMINSIFLEQFASFFRFSFINYQNHPIIKLPDETYVEIEYEFKAIAQELKKENSLIHLIQARAAVIATIISAQAEIAFTEFKVYQTNNKIASFNRLIDEFFREEKSVPFYAEKLHISANYLNILCKKHLKISATQLLHQRISTEAKKLLKNNQLTIKEISYNLGFSDNSYFSIFFKRQTGITPSEFRDLD